MQDIVIIVSISWPSSKPPPNRISPRVRNSEDLQRYSSYVGRTQQRYYSNIYIIIKEFEGCPFTQKAKCPLDFLKIFLIVKAQIFNAMWTFKKFSGLWWHHVSWICGRALSSEERGVQPESNADETPLLDNYKQAWDHVIATHRYFVGFEQLDWL